MLHEHHMSTPHITCSMQLKIISSEINLSNLDLNKSIVITSTNSLESMLHKLTVGSTKY